MKRVSLYISVLVFSLFVCVPSTDAARPQKGKKTTTVKPGTTTNPARVHDIHHIAFWGGAGYSGLVNNYPSATGGIGYNGNFSNKFVGGGGGLIGFGYEYKYKHFLLSAGPEFRIFSSADKLNIASPYQVLTGEYNQIKNYQFVGLSESQTVGQVMLPILFGGTFDKVYFKAGAKVGYTVLRNYRQEGAVTTTLTDPEAYDPSWADIPSHGAQTEQPYSHKGTNPFGLDVAVSAEVGVNIDKLLNDKWQRDNEKRERPVRMRIAVFADYGVLSMGVSSTTQAFASASVQSISTTSLHQSEWASSSLNSLLVGVKFTAMLQMNKEKTLVRKNPLLYIHTTDEETGLGLGNTQLLIAKEDARRPRKRATNGKGVTKMGLATGTYHILASRNGYIPSDTVTIEHEEDNEHVTIALRPVPVYTVTLQSAKNGKPVAGQLAFTDSESQRTVASATTDTVSGTYKTALPIGGIYRLHIEAEGYYPQDTVVEDLAAKDTILMQPVKPNIILHHVYFATNQTTILPTSEGGLQDLYTLLSENPEIRIRLIGHTDNVGSHRANQILSEGRANSIKQNMVDRGIDPDRIETEGRGKREPIATNDTEEGRAENRRVEMIIINEEQ